MNKKLFLVGGIILFVGVVGFQIADRNLFMLQSPGAIIEDYKESDYGLGDNYIDKLLKFPDLKKGERTPFDLYKYGGRDKSSFMDRDLGMSWDEWVAFHKAQKPKLMADVKKYMNQRYNFSNEPIEGVYMSGNRKQVMKGPISKLPEGISSFEELAELSAKEIKERNLFPYVPLAHPLHTNAHMVFPNQYLKYHPEHKRIDVDHDIPDNYLPEYPAPMFLTTHKEYGDITRGKEVTLSNYFEMFNGLLTPEQLEGLKELVKPTPSTFFNHTTHRVTLEPSAGVSCFSCHVNGHTNGAFEVAPDTRPQLARLRVGTPSMRGNYNLMQFSSKRSIRSMDHFAEVEEYFEGDPGIQQAIGPRSQQRQVTNRMGDFNAILDFPPAPKLDILYKLIPNKSTSQELLGEKIFNGKGKCINCHSGPAFVDDYMHDLKVEKFYVGRPEGPIKTFPLRGIKDSPPYLHDGRCMTLHDSVEFFNLILELKLSKEEKDALVSYLLCL
ncbi:MAG: cytochrome C [Bacteroidetes bacterium]|nr:cytochrome C [Bacteroidota bacterium]